MLLQNALVQKPAESNDNLGPRKKSLCDIGNLLNCVFKTLQNLALRTVDAEDKKEPEDALQAEDDINDQFYNAVKNKGSNIFHLLSTENQVKCLIHVVKAGAFKFRSNARLIVASGKASLVIRTFGSRDCSYHPKASIRVFRAGYNNLSGLLPDDIYNATTLQEIALPRNSLHGAISERIVNLTNLAFLDLQSNRLSGFLPVNIGNISTLNFSNLTKLTILDLGHNNFTGFLPTTLYSCKSVKAIQVSKNNLEGQKQPEILSLKSLSFLSLSYSRLTNITGAMRILMRCKSLKVLILSTTFYGEKIPSDEAMANFDGFQNLQMLDLSNCQLNGEIPQWLSKLKKLGILILNFNRITGSIPNDDVLELPIYTSTNRTFMQYKLSYFPRVIDVKNNSISGRIPIEIGQLQLIQKLDLNMNNFLGEIPEQISNLENLEELDLSMNHFSRKIPLSLASLSFLDSFNVSYNNLEGSIPTGTQLQSFNASAFEGNPKLCGPPLPKCLSSNGNDGENKNSQDLDDKSLWIGLSVVLGFVVGFLGFCCPLLLKRTWRYEYFQFLDNVQFKLYLVQRKIRPR
ncbi:receptor-like protein 2 [Malus sylvestris]|uniref:receptor-like protein 2 n=1 Tax=Malus sylvestris TaxID=3752 RepID=UPI0021ABAFA7|nr:receptor-like protein 2 [Malus sylvestris]